MSSRLTNLRLSMICDASKPHKTFACLEAKAAETKHLLPCLLAILREALPKDEPIHKPMLGCLSTFIEIGELYDAIGTFLAPSDFHKACSLAKRFFDSYHDLRQWALLKGRKQFHVTHKFHSYHHLIRNSKYLNYKSSHLGFQYTNFCCTCK